MREILFRAKRLDNGEWVEGSLVYVQEDADFMPGAYILPRLVSARADPPTKGIMLGGFFGVDPSTVCQYTGLTDKHEKKIFEGDIIKTTKYGVDDGEGHNYAGTDTYTIVFADGGYCLYNKWRRFNLRPDVNIEICGSIHDGEGGNG